MKRTRRRSFIHLVEENREALMRDVEALEKIEERLEQKHMKRI